MGMPISAPSAPPVYNWNGFYIGGNFGGGWGHANDISYLGSGVCDFAGSYDLRGVFGGGQIGFNYMVTPKMLIGVEADGDWSNINGSSKGCTTTECSTDNTALNNFGTVRGRIGYAWNNNWLLYGTGGWAWSNSGSDRIVTCSGATCTVGSGMMSPLVGMVASSSGTQSGWAAGAGVPGAAHWSPRPACSSNGSASTLTTSRPATARIPRCSTAVRAWI